MATSAAKQSKPKTKRGKKTAKKRELVEEIIKAEPKKRGRKPQDPQQLNVEPINRGVKKPNLAQRAGMARHLNVSTQTIYNREKAFDKCYPQYFEGIYYLSQKGGSLKVLPDLTPYQQFCQLQFDEVKRALGVKDCTPNEMVIMNNLNMFDIDLFTRQQQLTVDIEVYESSIESVESSNNTAE